MANNAAATQVGQTAELIELILSELSLFDIVVATGVNKTFRNVILGSTMLQRNTLLRATNALQQYWLPIKRHEDRTLYRTFTVDPDSLRFEPTPVSSTNYHDLPLRVVCACPLLKRPVEAQGFWAPNENPFEQLGWNPCSASPHQWYLLPAMGTPTGPLNWKQMFLTNPPCKGVRGTVLWEGWVHGVLVITLEATRHVYRQAGVTFADLFDDTYNKLGTIIVQTAYNDGHRLTTPHNSGGFVCATPMTSLHEQVEKMQKAERRA